MIGRALHDTISAITTRALGAAFTVVEVLARAGNERRPWRPW